EGEPHNVAFMKENYPSDFTYQDFAAQFTAEFFDPNYWAKVFQDSGVKYVVLTSKHHEGYTMWPSKYSWNWNAMDVGPHRDLVGEFAKAIKNNSTVKFGLYHSMYEWFNPYYLQDVANNFTTNDFVMKKTMPELYEIVERYEPEIVWSDGPHGPDWYWNSTVFLSWLTTNSTVKDTVVFNDRWGDEDPCTHGSFFTCGDRFNPGTLQPHKWENAMTMDTYSWGYRRNANIMDYLTIHDILVQLISTVSCGGNMLVNIGPTKEGMLPAIMEERLLQMGQWLSINGEAIYGSSPWKYQNDTLAPGVWYTAKGDSVYAFSLSWPTTDILTLASVIPTPQTHISMLGYDSTESLDFVEHNGHLEVHFPDMAKVSSKWVWVLQMNNVTPAPKP
ncbi:unnamed protein product, partial [Meganyctiphanes norvegica]